MGVFRANGIDLPPGEFGIPPADPKKPGKQGKKRWAAGAGMSGAELPRLTFGYGKAVQAGGMIYVSSVGPIDMDSGQLVPGGMAEQTSQCVKNLKARLESVGSSLDKIVWANWSLRDPGDFDAFNEEWLRWFPGDAPVGQGTLMPASHRRAGFRVSMGVIAEA
jgi:2-iminobutanoate/2-iminopropanoate deaminase